MAVDVARLRAFVNTSSNDDADLESCLATSRVLLDGHIGDCARDVPDAVYERALLVVAAEMFNQAKAPNGILNQQYDEGAGSVIRIGSDPMRPAYPLLSRYVPPRIA